MVSLIIPTLNAGRNLEKLLEALKGQTVKPDEIIIIDSNSTDNTQKIARDHGARLTLIGRERFDHGGTRTKVAREAKGGFLVFLTQDVMPVDERAVENLLRPLKENEGIGGAYGRQLPRQDASVFGAHLRLFNYPERSYVFSSEDRQRLGLRRVFFSNSFSVYRRKALEEMGWFRDGLIMGEDTVAAARMLVRGWKIAYAANASVYHSHSYCMWEEFKRYFDVGVFHVQEDWLLAEFGKAEGEGLRYIMSELRYLVKGGAPHLIPFSIVRNVLKYVGYKLGLHHGSLPLLLCRRLSMHPPWWNRSAE
jgi:rhamnosyltransferase